MKSRNRFTSPRTIRWSISRPRILKHGDTFALFDHYGDLASRPWQYSWHLPLRHAISFSRLKLTIERRSPLLLSSTVRTNNAVLDVDLTNPDIQHGETLVLAKDTHPSHSHEVPVERGVL